MDNHRVNSEESLEILTKVSFFFDQYSPRQVPRQTTLIRSEEEPSGVFFLKKGCVRFYSISPEGKELTLNIFKPGSFFPMTWAMGDRPNVYFYESLTDAEVIRAPRQKFVDFLRQNPDILFDFTKRAFVGMDGLMTRMETLLFGNASERVASVLLLMAQRFGESDGNGQIRINLRLTHQQIANLAGLSREPTSLELKKFERAGILVSSRGNLIISNQAKLLETSQVYRQPESPPFSF